MRRISILVAFAMLAVSWSIQGQAPQVVSAQTVGDSGKVRVTFNVPVTPAGTTVLLADDFSGATLDPARWEVDDTPLEAGGAPTAGSRSIQAGGVLTIDLEAGTAPWPGIALQTVPTFSASASTPLVFELDRVAHDEDGEATRTGVWITDAARAHFVLFAENEGGGGWQYNRQIGGAGDNPTGMGAITALVNGGAYNDLDSHHLTALLDGSTIRLYLDGQFATEIPFPFGNGIHFAFGAYAAEAGDEVSGVFDNARVSRLEPANPALFTIDPGATVTGVSLTSDPRVLELTSTGMQPGTAYTLTVQGVQAADGTVIPPKASVAIGNGPVNSSYTAEVLKDKPVAYYTMDQIDGTTVPNLGSTGPGATGKYQPGPRSLLTRGPGLPDFPGFDPGNTAALFDGIGTYTDDDGNVQLEGLGTYIDTQSLLLTDLPAFTIEAWIRPANLDEDRLGLVGTFGTEFGFSNPSQIHIYTGGGGIIYAPYPFRFNEWHHIVVTGSGTNLLMYADGHLLAGVEDTTDTYDGEDRNVYIGGGGIFDDVEADGFGNWFPGGLDEVAIYTNALPAERIQAHFGAAFAAALRPTVAITSPMENAAITPGAAVTITTQTSASTGRAISKVEFLDRSIRIGEATTAPFSFTLSSISEGRHALSAKAYDDLGVSTVSTPVRFLVGTPRPLLVLVVASLDQPTESDEEVEARLRELGFDVQTVQARDLSPSDVSEAALVVVPVIRVDSVAEMLRGLAVPVVTWDQDLEPTFLFTEDEVDVAWGDTPGVQFEINIVQPAHPLAAGLAEGLNEIVDGQEFAWGVPGPEATIVGTLADDTSRAVLYAYDKGARLIDGSVAPERRVFFILTDDTFLALNENGLKLFDAAIHYAARTVEPLPVLTLSRTQGPGLVLSWTGSGTLQAAEQLPGTWTDLTNASPQTITVEGARRFYRVRQ